MKRIALALWLVSALLLIAAAASPYALWAQEPAEREQVEGQQVEGQREGQEAQRQQAKRPVALVAIDGPIGPATTDLLRRALQEAEHMNASALVLRLDTPGGLEAATRDIDQAILASPLPVVSWVAPGGARAASAGTFIMYASHVAAMAPATHLGAATPVPLGGQPPPGDRDRAPAGDDETDDTEQPAAREPATAMERKILHDSAAYIRTLAELRGRNAEWAERAVRNGESATASEALKLGVIDFIAPDLASLLAELDGREVSIDDQVVVLVTADAQVVEILPDWRNQLLALLTNPSVAYLLLLAGLYGLLLEGYNPGSLVPGVVGVVCLLLAAYALQILPVNYVGLALIVLGVLLMVGEMVTPSFGVLGIGGAIALVLGSVVLFDEDVPGFQVSRGLIGAIAMIAAAGMMLLIMLLQRSRSRPVQTGRHELLAAHAVALEDFERRGRVRVRGEVWCAISPVAVSAGQQVQVVDVDGLTLQVRPLASGEGLHTATHN